MGQSIKQLKMVYHLNQDGSLLLLKAAGKAFGFSDETLLKLLLEGLDGAPGFTLVVRDELVMVDDRFPLEIDPARTSIHAIIREAWAMAR